MSEKGGRLLLTSRRDLLKGGALLALSSPIGFPGLAKVLTQSPQGPTSGPPNPATQPASPEWMKDLIIYEIATKGFTSPKGPESGTFSSLQAKLSYLEELGITGIWFLPDTPCVIPTTSTTSGRNMQ